MQAFIPCGVVLWVSVTGAAMAASASSPSAKLRFTKEYAQFLCEQQKLENGPSGNLFRADGNVSEEASSDWLDAEVRLREKFKSAISNPYPPELQGYRPKSFEFVELHWATSPCSQGGDKGRS